MGQCDASIRSKHLLFHTLSIYSYVYSPPNILLSSFEIYGFGAEFESLQGENDDINLCTQLFYNAWAMCDNDGVGGSLPVEAGCLRYSVIPDQSDS